MIDGFPETSGPIGLYSGDEFLAHAEAFDRAFIALTGPRIGLILCADHRAAPKSARLAFKHFSSIGGEIVHDDLIHSGDDPEVDLVYIAGGGPGALRDHLSASPAWARIVDRWRRAGLGIAGSSAGAMVLCEHCLIPEPRARVPTMWSHGLGIVPGVALAVHATSRPAAWMREVARAAPCPLVAIDDHTGILLRRGSSPRVIGTGKAWVVDQEGTGRS